MPYKILNNLWQVGGMDFTDSADAAIYLIQFGNTAALVDAGTGIGHTKLKKHLSECLSPNATLEYLLLTHCHFDHTGGAAAIRDDFGCKIVAHTLDAQFLENGDSNVTAASWYGARLDPLPIDIKLQKNETVIELGDGRITALHWPGHSPGSLIFVTKVENQKVVFAQDVHGPIHPALKSNNDQYQKSLHKLLKLNSDLLLEGHYGIFKGNPSISDFVKSFMV